MTLSVEEPDITSVSIRPGTVDTAMQQDIREKHAGSMDAKDAAKFASLKSEGKLLRPEQPGDVIAKLAVGATKELSGRFLK
jgi:NAD(P)-dependent dehydrogenase (short-subunit alcohol dehydrogenase family)